MAPHMFSAGSKLLNLFDLLYEICIFGNYFIPVRMFRWWTLCVDRTDGIDEGRFFASAVLQAGEGTAEQYATRTVRLRQASQTFLFHRVKLSRRQGVVVEPIPADRERYRRGGGAILVVRYP